MYNDTCILYHLQAKRVVVVVSVCKFPGGVFTDTPDSYFVDEHGNIEKWKFYEWKLAMLNPLRGKDIFMKKCVVCKFIYNSHSIMLRRS